MTKEKFDWFKEIFPEVPSELPPTLRIKKGKKYRVTFKEKRPRIVTGGYGKKTAVINVKYEGESRSLFLGSHADLARQIYMISNEGRDSLLNKTVEFTKIEKKGRFWAYKVELV